MPEPTVLTVILNYRTPAMTLEAVEAALREMADIAGEIVVVDNDSGDGSFETISAAVAAAGWDATASAWSPPAATAATAPATTSASAPG